MSLRQGDKVLAGSQSLTQDLFDFKWSDHKLDDIQWLRADTFSWQDGELYEIAYQHLLDEWNEVGDHPSYDTVAGITVYYRLAPDGHKICTASQEDEVLAIYNATGIAWYYIIDTVNSRFKLPRTKFGFSGLRDQVGNYVPESAPNIKGRLSIVGNGATSATFPLEASGAFYGRVKGSGKDAYTNSANNEGLIEAVFDASRSSAAYQDGAPVKERSTQMYLYFFVGCFTQSALVNTAGVSAEMYASKQDISTALNYDNVTNCITEIPQDIKLELNNGTLTLKAGSKVYVPNGAGVFDEVVRNSDLVYSFGTPANGRYLVFNSQYFYLLSNCVSGATDSKAGQAYHSWYDTTNNLIKQYWADGSTPARTDSLPVAIITISGGVITSIDQVFNGFGYIGSTKFVLPRVSGLIPDGFNSDGTMKSIPFVVENVLTTTGASTDTAIGFVGADSLANHSSATYRYDPKTNLIVRNSDGVPYSSITGVNRIPFTNPYYQINGEIQYCSFHNVFHAVDYNEADFVVEFQRPTAANNYTWYRKYKSGWVEQGGRANLGATVTFPVIMTNTNYTLVITTNSGDTGTQSIGTSSLTTSSFYANRYTGGSNLYSWQISGMAA